MGVTANVGLPGTGKTLHAVGHDIVKALKQRRLVVTNVPLNIDALSKFIGFDVTQLIIKLDEHDDGTPAFSKLTDFTEYESWKSDGDKGYGCLFVVDECHNAFGHVVGIQAVNHELTLWFAEHRHKGCDVLLITQARQEIPPVIRRRVEYTYEFRKLSAFGFSNRYVKLTFHGRGDDALRRDLGKYPSEWFCLYQSRGKGIAELIGKPSNIFLNWRLMLAFGGVAIAFIYISSGDGPNIPGAGATTSTGTSNVSATATDSPSNALNSTGFNLPSPATESSQVKALREEITQLQLERKRDGELNVTTKLELQGQRLRITGYMLIDGKPIYWLSSYGPRGRAKIQSDVLRVYGYEFRNGNRCIAWVHHQKRVWRVTCDGETLIDHFNYEPVTASE